MFRCPDGGYCVKKFEYGDEVCKLYYNCSSNYPCNGMNPEGCMMSTVTDFRPCPYYECSAKPIIPIEPRESQIYWIIGFGISFTLLCFLFIYIFRKNLIKGKMMIIKQKP